MLNSQCIPSSKRVCPCMDHLLSVLLGFIHDTHTFLKKPENITALCGLGETGQQVTTNGRGRVPGT